jgi:hypothetical protein
VQFFFGLTEKKFVEGDLRLDPAASGLEVKNLAD